MSDTPYSAIESFMPPATKIRVPEEVSPTTIRNAMKVWISQLPRYSKLYDYYIGRHRIVTESGREGRSKIVANLCQYITDTVVGYMVGYPPEYNNAEGDSKADEITELYRKQNMEKVDSEIAQTLSIYGRAISLVYLDENAVPKTTVFSPRDAFVAYAGDVESDSVFGAIVYEDVDKNNESYYRLYIYDRSEFSIWEGKAKNDLDSWTQVTPPRPHGFNRVPLIEYTNNRDGIGDFEGIIAMQDAYNSLLSDRQDNKDAFSSAILMITGHVLGETPDEVEESLGGLKKRKVLQFDDETGSAAYLDHTMDDTGAQTLQDQYKNDIHKLAMVPDLSDEQFASNASGVAMAYKLFGTDQKIAKKIAGMQAGYTRRCKLYDVALFNSTRSPNYKAQADISSMEMTFRLNAPQDLSYMATALTTLTSAGIISKQTARASLQIVTNAQVEEERVAHEAEDEAQRNRLAFEDDFSGNDGRNDQE